MSREVLKQARKSKGMTQRQVAERLGLKIRQYIRIETGDSLGSIGVWDKLERMFKIHQMKLREISENHPDKGDNQ